MPRIDLTGNVYGRLTVLSYVDKDKTGCSKWFCLCECGNIKVISSKVFKNSKFASCGCLRTFIYSESAKKHGYYGTKEYRAWQAIKNRCLNSRDKSYYKYGGKGITVCSEWINSFESFINHVGKCPGKKFSIDRIDNTKGYEPGNVRWATISEQQKNRSVCYFWFIDGIKFDSITEAASHFSVTNGTIYKWVYGYFDKRRNKFTQPKTNCFNERKYV